jgi:hypothetical protein
MNKNSAHLSISPAFQRLLDELSTVLKLSQQILILNIINLDIQMVILLPVLKVFEVIPQD